MNQVVGSKCGEKVELTCDCECGTIFYRYRNKIRCASNYVNRQHQAAFERKRHLQVQCGPYLPLFTEYLEGAAKQRYCSTNDVRKLISPFFRYLCERGIQSINDVSPDTITAFQIWALQNGYASASKDTSALSVFFQWTIVEGHYRGESPVIPAIHGKRKEARSGRPYTDVEMSEIRRLLEDRGNERLRAFFEIASESGMRKSEICRLGLEDVAIDTQTLNVGVPNKTMRERVAFFSDRASTRIREWLAVRKKDCGHQFLFHNHFGRPLLRHVINDEFKRVLCKTYRGRNVNDTGLASFSIHRLRHTLASNLSNNGADANTLMACLGWVCPESVDGYTKLDESTKIHGFITATRKAEQQVADGFGKCVLTPEEFLLLTGEI
jgi:integrase/recombinase XerC